MTRRAALASALAALALPAAASAETTTISIPGKYFVPSRATIVAGDSVTFRNIDFSTHDVRIAGGLFASGPLPRFSSWSQQVDQPGSYPYICTLHPFMSGQFDAVAATLAATPDGVIAGEQLELSGRAPAGTAHVAIEQSIAGGEWSAVGAGATPAPDGTFNATARAVESASYRARTASGAGQVVTPRVTAHVDVGIDVMRQRRHTSVRVHTTPVAHGFSATLEVYARWHFRWRPRRTVKLDSNGRASFRLPASQRSFARVALRRKRGGPALVHSGVVRLASGKPARDPDMIMPPGGGH